MESKTFQKSEKSTVCSPAGSLFSTVIEGEKLFLSIWIFFCPREKPTAKNKMATTPNWRINENIPEDLVLYGLLFLKGRLGINELPTTILLVLREWQKSHISCSLYASC